MAKRKECDWLVTAYDENKKVIEAFIIEQRTEKEANDEAEIEPCVLDSHDWTMVDAQKEAKRFVKEWGQTQKEVKEVNGFRGSSLAVSEMAINFGYIWVDNFKKWIYKDNSNFDERDEIVLDYIKENYCE